MKLRSTLLGAAVFLVSAVAVGAQDRYLIRPYSAGPVSTGMTIAEARKALPGDSFKRTTDGEGLALVAVESKGELQMTLFAGEDDPDKPIDPQAKIEYIEVFGKMYHTPFGVHPGMTIAEAETKAGKLKEIVTSEIEAREFATFANQPDEYNIRVLGKNDTAGIYSARSNKAAKYSEGAYVFSVGVFGKPKDDSFTSVYTDLGKECKQEPLGEDSQHASTKCQGPDGWQVHIFDSATTLEFSLEKGESSVRIASQSLSYPLKNAKLEWRLKDGKPFAGILRTYTYRRGSDGLISYPAKETGEYLTVKGLAGYPEIDYEVDARAETNANEKARTLADTGYSIAAAPSKSDDEQVILKIAGEFSEAKSRNISISSKFADVNDRLTVTVIDDGLLDDSVRGEKIQVELQVGSDGVWKVLSYARTWRCWDNRGHTDFSEAPCILMTFAVLAIALAAVSAFAQSEAPGCGNDKARALSFLDGKWTVRSRYRASSNPERWEETSAESSM